ncbi:MAG TPA: DUF3597 domain-containing protein [Casimicrobiaceae bacterium]|jgi:hypothetical protein
MSIFGTILDKILHHSTGSAQAAGTTASGQPAQQAAGTSPTAQQTQAGGGAAPQSGTSPAGAPAAAQARLQSVDVDAVLSRLASQKGGGGNWRTSIVDLLKLLDMDSSLTARKELGNELNVHAGADGSAEQNIALQKAVMQKIAENGGKVPDSLRH